MELNSKIYIAGHQGLVGGTLLEYLQKKGYSNLLTRDRSVLDLTNQTETLRFFKSETPDFVILAAAKVGGIATNIKNPADFLYVNLMIEANVINSAFLTETKRLIFLGSSCIYPRLCDQPMREDYILTGPFEPTNEGYAVAKVAGLKLCSFFNRQYGTYFKTIIPPNLYGPRDNFDFETSHVIPALIRRFHEAKVQKSSEVVVWGSGKARREFMFVEDLADAIHHLMSIEYEYDVINVGVGDDVSIRELAETVSEVVGYDGEIVFDSSKPDGMPRKLVDNSRIRSLGWEPKTSLEKGLRVTYDWFLKNKEADHGR